MDSWGIVTGCNAKPETTHSSALTGPSQYGGTFQAYINGTLKDGAINIQYQTGSTGEFELDDTNGPLSGSKNMSYTVSGATATVTSTECPGDTFVIRHNTQSGQSTFDGSLCGTNITSGSAHLVSN